MFRRLMITFSSVLALLALMVFIAPAHSFAASHSSPIKPQVQHDCPTILFDTDQSWHYDGVKANSSACGGYINVVVTYLSGSGTVTGTLSDGTTHSYPLTYGKIHVFQNVITGTSFSIDFNMDDGSRAIGYIEP